MKMFQGHIREVELSVEDILNPTANRLIGIGEWELSGGK